MPEWPLLTDGIANYDARLTATISAYIPQLRNNIFDSNPTLDLLREHGCIKPYTKGGVGLTIPVLYGRNTTGGWMRSAYDLVDLTPQEGMGNAQYTKARAAWSITFSRDDEEDNVGAPAIFSLLEAKMKQLEMSAMEDLQDVIYVGQNSGADTEKPIGIQEIVNVTLTIGTISPVSYTWWTPQAVTATDYDDMTNWTGITHMEELYAASKFAGFAPDMFPCNPATWRATVKMMTSKSEFPLTGRRENIGRVGWDGVAFKGGDLYEDKEIPTATGNVMFFLCSKALTLYNVPSSNFTLGPKIAPNNQLAWSRLMTWRGGLVTDLRRVHGKLTVAGI